MEVNKSIIVGVAAFVFATISMNSLAMAACDWKIFESYRGADGNLYHKNISLANNCYSTRKDCLGRIIRIRDKYSVYLTCVHRRNW